MQAAWLSGSGLKSEAAGVRFELTEACTSTVFKTAPFDRSGTPPALHRTVDGAVATHF